MVGASLTACTRWLNSRWSYQYKANFDAKHQVRRQISVLHKIIDMVYCYRRNKNSCIVQKPFLYHARQLMYSLVLNAVFIVAIAMNMVNL